MTLNKLISLRGKKALVTGATGHLGRVICKTLAELGAEIIMVDQPGSDFKHIQKYLKKKWNTRSSFYSCDFEYESQRTQMIHDIKLKNRKISILVNNAAFVGTSNLPGWSVPFEKQSLETWRRAFEVNLTTPFHLCQAFVQELRKGEGGSIINITSIYGEYGPDWRIYKGTKMGNPAAYSASKGGLVQFTRWLATTLAPNVRVNAISPGGIIRDQENKFISSYKKKTPMARMGKEIDFQGALAFLGGKSSSYVTGQILRVDGGWGVW
jgi:NAD(P)-dependent dehydrogenase (short-subunit alcohol dehydrogenase family)